MVSRFPIRDRATELPARKREKMMVCITMMERKIETGMQEHAGKKDCQRGHSGSPCGKPGQSEQGKRMKRVEYDLPARIEVRMSPDGLLGQTAESGPQIKRQHRRIGQQRPGNDGRRVLFPFLLGKQQQIDNGMGRRIHGYAVKIITGKPPCRHHTSAVSAISPEISYCLSSIPKGMSGAMLLPHATIPLTRVAPLAAETGSVTLPDLDSTDQFRPTKMHGALNAKTLAHFPDLFDGNHSMPPVSTILPALVIIA